MNNFCVDVYFTNIHNVFVTITIYEQFNNNPKRKPVFTNNIV